MNTEHSRIRRILAKSPLYHFFLKLRSIFEFNAVTMFGKSSNDVELNTAYCISPYKTGTTYLTELFKNTCRAAHEPLHYTTLVHIRNNDFLKKRASYLNLDLECSGFFADKLIQLRRIAPNAPILLLIRSPEAWIGSVINYFAQLNNRVSYNYVARMIFDPICGERIEYFYESTPIKQTTIVTALLEYWIRVYTEAANDPKTLIIQLERLDKSLILLEEFFGHTSRLGVDIWKRENKDKKQFYLGTYVDLSLYKEKIRAFGYF